MSPILETSKNFGFQCFFLINLAEIFKHIFSEWSKHAVQKPSESRIISAKSKLLNSIKNSRQLERLE